MKKFFATLAVAFLILSLSLLRVSTVESQQFDSSASPYVSDFVQSRGWPLSAIAMNPISEGGYALGKQVILDAFLVDIIFSIIVSAVLVWATTKILKRSKF